MALPVTVNHEECNPQKARENYSFTAQWKSRAKCHNAAGKIAHFYLEEFMSNMLVLMNYI